MRRADRGAELADDGAATKSAVERVFSMTARDYDQSGVEFFGLFGRLLVGHLAPSPDWHVLDVGSGRGAVVRPLLAALGETGRITAVDLAVPMVELLREELAQQGITNVETMVGDVEQLALPDGGFDGATASMVLFFVPDPGRALRSLLRVLRPGGRLAFTLFGEADARWGPVYDAFLPFLPGADPDEDLSRPRHPGLNSVAQTRTAVEGAGFVDVSVWEETHPIRFDSVEQWHTWSWSIGLRGSWLQIPEPDRARARDAVLDQVSRLRSVDGSLAEDFTVRFAIGTRPDVPAG